MKHEFPEAVPEIPVENVDNAVAYYVTNLVSTLDWGGEQPEGIAGISKGNCRLFLTNRSFREWKYRNTAPVVIWINLFSKEEIDELYELWRNGNAKIISPPESKPWKLYEFYSRRSRRQLLQEVFHGLSQES